MKDNSNTFKKYGDIIHLPAPKSKTRIPMQRKQRAAQFAPFAALKGYEDSLSEKVRLTKEKPIISQERKQKINDQLLWIESRFKENPLIEIQYFAEDAKKSGGHILTKKTHIKKINKITQYIFLQDGTSISLKDILQIEFL